MRPSTAKVVKSFTDNRVAIALMETDSGQYCLRYRGTNTGSEKDFSYSEPVQDFKLASDLFDEKLRALLGN